MTDSTFDMFQWMTPEVKVAFGLAVRRRRYDAGQMIYVQGEPGLEMFRLVTGSIRMSVRRRDGREIIYLLFEPGDCFGDSSLVDGDPRPQTAEALTAVEADVLDRAAFDRLRADQRGFDDALLKLLSRQMRVVSAHYAGASLGSLTARVAGRISEAARAFGEPAEGGVRLSLRLSQSEVAMMVGASRQSVNKILQRFQADGLLTIEYGNILVRDLAAILRLAIDD